MGPCGFWHVHMCWGDHGLMAKMGTSDPPPAPATVQVFEVGDWDVNSGRRRLGA